MTISLDPSVVSLQCSSQRTPIIDPSVQENTDDDIAKNTLNSKSTINDDSHWTSRSKLFKRVKKLKVQS